MVPQRGSGSCPFRARQICCQYGEKKRPVAPKRAADVMNPNLTRKYVSQSMNGVPLTTSHICLNALALNTANGRDEDEEGRDSSWVDGWWVSLVSRGHDGGHLSILTCGRRHTRPLKVTSRKSETE